MIRRTAMNRAALAWLFAAAGAFGCGGGGGSGGPPAATNHSPTAVPDSASRVVVMGQSAQPQAAGDLLLDARNAYAGLVDVPAFGGCANLLRVKPGDPDSSVLILKMSGVTCGLRMPPPEQTYYDRAAGELALVRTWILDGAPNN